jgi:general secretion pathway protein A
MYRKHFGLIRYPFRENLDNDDLFAGSAQQEAEARLRHLLDLRGIGLVTGEVGSGKTTLCRKVSQSLHAGL